MTFSVTMPALGESVSEGTVTRWLKAEGDHVNVDEPLLEVSTDKVDTEIPSPVAGTLQKIVVQVDQTVPVGAELAIIADGSATPAPVAAAPVASPVVPTPAPAPVAAAPVTPPPAPAAPTATGAGTVITMPALGESVSEGTVTRWLKNVGDLVAVDEALLEVSTDKVDTEIPSPVAGTLLAIDVAVDTTVPVGARLGLIGAANGAAAAPAPVVPAPVVAAPVTPPPAPVASAPVSQPADAYVTPLVRKLASELGVNLAQVTGTGIGGRIRREDVEALARPAATGAETTGAATTGTGGGVTGAATTGAGAATAPLAAPINPRRAPTGTVVSTATSIARRVPATGEGISVSTLSVETSSSASSTATESPMFFNQRVTVPSETLSPRAGIVITVPVPEGAAATTGAAATGAGAGV